MASVVLNADEVEQALTDIGDLWPLVHAAAYALDDELKGRYAVAYDSWRKLNKSYQKVQAENG